MDESRWSEMQPRGAKFWIDLKRNTRYLRQMLLLLLQMKVI